MFSYACEQTLMFPFNYHSLPGCLPISSQLFVREEPERFKITP